MGLMKRISGWFKKPDKKLVKKDFSNLKIQAIKELEKIKNKKRDEKFLEELNKIFRIFLKERFELKRSLTYEEMGKDEMIEKIDGKVKREILDIASKIYQITYKHNSKKLKENSFNSIFNQIGVMIKNS